MLWKYWLVPGLMPITKGGPPVARSLLVSYATLPSLPGSPFTKVQLFVSPENSLDQPSLNPGPIHELEPDRPALISTPEPDKAAHGTLP